MTALLRCPCGGVPDVENVLLGGWDGPWVIHCPDCYDGAPDGKRQAVTSFKTFEDAAEGWNELVMEEMEASHVA